MRYLLVYLILGLICFLMGIKLANAKTIRVGVIDTGIPRGLSDGLCKTGHKDFTGTGLYDYHGHGTNVTGLIHKYAKGVDYCQVHFKYWVPGLTGAQTDTYFQNSIREALRQKLDIINISGGGFGFYQEEFILINKLLNRGTVIIVAAGNNHKYLEKIGKFGYYFPAQYDSRIIVVGSGYRNKVHSFSNYGPVVDVYENGMSARGLFGPVLTGTSQATAIHTGKVIRRWEK